MILEKAKVDGLKIEEHIKEIREKIHMTTADVFDQEVIQEKDMWLEELKRRIQEVFFSTTEPLMRHDFSRVENISAIWNNFGNQEADWESTFAKCVEDLDGLEFQISMLLPIMMEEVVTVVSRFIERNAVQKDKDASP
jgi:hypothetical protein